MILASTHPDNLFEVNEGQPELILNQKEYIKNSLISGIGRKTLSFAKMKFLENTYSHNMPLAGQHINVVNYAKFLCDI